MYYVYFIMFKQIQSNASAVGFELAIPGFEATEHLRNRTTTMIDYHVTFTEQLWLISIYHSRNNYDWLSCSIHGTTMIIMRDENCFISRKNNYNNYRLSCEPCQTLPDIASVHTPRGTLIHLELYEVNVATVIL